MCSYTIFGQTSFVMSMKGTVTMLRCTPCCTTWCLLRCVTATSAPRWVYLHDSASCIITGFGEPFGMPADLADAFSWSLKPVLDGLQRGSVQLLLRFVKFMLDRADMHIEVIWTNLIAAGRKKRAVPCARKSIPQMMVCSSCLYLPHSHSPPQRRERVVHWWWWWFSQSVLVGKKKQKTQLWRELRFVEVWYQASAIQLSGDWYIYVYLTEEYPLHPLHFKDDDDLSPQKKISVVHQ